MSEIVALNPTFEERVGEQSLAPALRSLKGATIGLLDNSKKNVGHFLQYVGEELVERHGVATLVRRRKVNMSAPAPQEVMIDLIPCDAVIIAIGD
jgi:hypothetical protein